MAYDDQEQLAAIDEILQVMYWLRGERLAAEVSATDLTRWLGPECQRIAWLLQRMCRSQLLQQTGAAADGSPRYALTESGLQEAARRFADEFAELIRPGHGQCSDPNCDCHSGGNPADCAGHTESPTRSL